MEFLSIAAFHVLSTLFIFCFAYVLFFISDAKSWKIKENAKRLRGLAGIPGPKRMPIIGNLLQLPKPENVFKKCFEWCSKYGSVFRVTVFGRNYVVIANATMAQAILQSTESGHLGKTDVYMILKELKGLAFTSGERWNTLRKLAAPAFGYKNIESRMLFSSRNAENLVEILRNHFSSNSTHDKHLVEDYIATCAVSIVIGISFSDSFITGPECTTFEKTLNYVKTWKRYTELITYRMLHPWLAIDVFWRLHPLHSEYQCVVSQLNKFADNILFKHMTRIKHEGKEDSLKVLQLTYVAELIKAGYTHEEIHSEILSMLFGYEAFFLGLLYLLFLLATHPEHQQKCYEEVDSVIAQEHTWTTQKLSELKHLERCFMEALRMFPPAFIYGRRLTSDLIVQDDVLLPSGTNIFILPLVMHKNPEYYPNPQTFDPDRFLPENHSKRSPYSFLPFSGGPRVCLGMKPAILSAKIITASLLKSFIITSTDTLDTLEFNLSLGMVPKNGVDLKFTPRKVT